MKPSGTNGLRSEPDRPLIPPTLSPMSCTASFLDLAQRLGARLLSDIAARDGAHLMLPQPSTASFDPPGQMIASRPPATPTTLTKAAAARLKAGLRAVEAYLRRVVLALALEMAPTLDVDQSEYVKYASRAPKASPVRAPSFRVLDTYQPFPEAGIDRRLSHPHPWAGQEAVPAAPLLHRLSALKTLLAAPEVRARRLAFHLVRACSGALLPPGFGRLWLKGRYGTEVSAHYDQLGAQIISASRVRPKALGPRPRAGPRIRCL